MPIRPLTHSERERARHGRAGLYVSAFASCFLSGALWAAALIAVFIDTLPHPLFWMAIGFPAIGCAFASMLRLAGVGDADADTATDA